MFASARHTVAALSRYAGLMTLVAALPGCLQLRFTRDTRLEPLDVAVLDRLVNRDESSARDDLAAALAALGPPLDAWELEQGGMALAWGWYREAGWQATLSVPLSEHGGSASIDYASRDANLRGAVLFFDPSLRLIASRRGYLRELRSTSRARPQFHDDTSPASGETPR